MTRVRYDPEFSHQYMRFSLPFFVTFGLTLVFIWWKIEILGAPKVSMLTMLGMLVGFLQAMISYEVLRRRYRCQVCHRRLKKWKELHPNTFAYHCRECGIEWRVWIGWRSKRSIGRDEAKANSISR